MQLHRGHVTSRLRSTDRPTCLWNTGPKYINKEMKTWSLRKCLWSYLCRAKFVVLAACEAAWNIWSVAWDHNSFWQGTYWWKVWGEEENPIEKRINTLLFVRTACTHSHTVTVYLIYKQKWKQHFICDLVTLQRYSWPIGLSLHNSQTHIQTSWNFVKVILLCKRGLDCGFMSFLDAYHVHWSVFCMCCCVQHLLPV